MLDYLVSCAQTHAIDTVPSQERSSSRFGTVATKVGGKTVRTGISIYDAGCSIDYCIGQLVVRDGGNPRDLIKADTIKTIGGCSVGDQARFVGTGVTLGLEEPCPGIFACFCRKLVVPSVHSKILGQIPINVDESADSVARKNKVMPDAQGATRATGTTKFVGDLREYKDTVHKRTWNTVLEYIPKPNPKAFRIPKTNHNILQGVTDPEARSDGEKRPYSTNRCGGMAVVRLCEVSGYLFIRHPVDKFVPPDVPLAIVELVPTWANWYASFASSSISKADKYRLDGPNKRLREWDLRSYHHNLQNSCNEIGMNQLLYSTKGYNTRIMKFDPSKGIPDVLESYRKLCARMIGDAPQKLPVVIDIFSCEHGVVYDPDALILLAKTMELLSQLRYILRLRGVWWSWDSGQKVKMSGHTAVSAGSGAGTVGNAACWLYVAAGLAR
ncbi:hypothetical protein HOY80DRAFT_1107197 [Tuber brumale]|nr:hypothetical protein HOY80DRAFT_1107197 [Tuber brumale]